MSDTGSAPEAERTPDWRDAAACRQEDPDLFFPKGYDGPSAIQTEQAKAVCRRCPVLDQCQQWALAARVPAGVWGGLSERERAAILRRRGIRLPTAAEDETPATTVRPKTGRPRAECGTPAAYDRHLRNREPVDAACRKAHAEKTARYRATGSTKVPS